MPSQWPHMPCPLHPPMSEMDVLTAIVNLANQPMPMGAPDPAHITDLVMMAAGNHPPWHQEPDADKCARVGRALAFALSRAWDSVADELEHR